MTNEAIASGGGSEFRGQSPDESATTTRPRRQNAYRPIDGEQVGDVHIYAEPADDSAAEDTETAGYVDDSEINDAAPTRHTVQKPPISDAQRPPSARRPINPAYRDLFADRDRNASRTSATPTPQSDDQTVVRGQSQGYPPQSPYPYSAPAGNQYGGQAVGATGPDSNRAINAPATNQPAARVAQNNTGQPAFEPVVPLSPSQSQTFPQQDPPWQLFPQYPPMQPGGLDDPAVDLYVNLEETETGRFMAGASVNSDLGVFGNFVIEEQNFDWRRFPTGWEDIRNGTAWRGNGQRFRLEAAPGNQVQRYLVSLQQPYLWDSPITLGLSGSFYDRRYVDWDEQRVGGRLSLGYQWVERNLAATLSYRGERVNVRNPAVPTPPELLEVLGNNELHGFRADITNDTRDSTFLATQGHFLQMSFEQVVGTYDYPIAILDMHQYFLLHERPDRSGRHVFSYSGRLGVAGSQTPIYDHFFAGGTSTLRGFDFRGASPLAEVGGVVRVGGDFMWINSVEYLFPISADDMIRGVAFCDFGTVERQVEINDFRVSPGLGLRIIVPAMGPAPIALDFATPVLDAPGDERQVFSFTVGFQR